MINRIVRNSVAALAAAALFTPSLVAQASDAPTPDPQAIARADASMEKVIAAAHVPSIAIAIARNGTTLYRNAYGYANLANHTPATVATHYEIGSITKQFTAAAIFQLKEGGKLALDDTVGKWIPEYPRAAAVTIRELLQQTTGIPDYTDVDGFEKIAGTQKPSFAAILALISKKPLLFKSGSQFSYSNTNYIILGEIVERASGTPWETYIRNNIFAAAGMTSSGFISDEAKLQPMATGYVVDKKGVKIAPPLLSGWAWSAGAIVSTVDDLLAWDSALFRGRIINQTDLAAMLAPGRPAGPQAWYASGWMIDASDGHKRIWHNGGTFGFLSANLIFPRDRYAIVVFQNAEAGMIAPEGTAMRVFEAFEPSATTANAGVKGENPAITTRVREWIGRLESGNIDRSQLSAHMNEVLTPQMVGGIKEQFATLGAPQRLTFVGKTTSAKGTIYTYRAVFAATTFSVRLGIDPAGKIAGFNIAE